MLFKSLMKLKAPRLAYFFTGNLDTWMLTLRRILVSWFYDLSHIFQRKTPVAIPKEISKVTLAFIKEFYGGYSVISKWCFCSSFMIEKLLVAWLSFYNWKTQTQGLPGFYLKILCFEFIGEFESVRHLVKRKMMICSCFAISFSCALRKCLLNVTLQFKILDVFLCCKNGNWQQAPLFTLKRLCCHYT